MMGILVCVIFLFVGSALFLIVHSCIGGSRFRWFITPPVVSGTSNICYNRPKVDPGQLPCYDMTAEENGSSSPADCAVCLENLKVGDQCRLLPRCNHSFHSQCIDSWLLRTPICPICRTSATLKESCKVSEEGSSQQNEIEIEGEFELMENQEIAEEVHPSSSPPHTSSESAG